MPYKTPTHQRKSAFEAQHGQCCYCGMPMWLDDAPGFARSHNLSQRQTRWFQCTAEHLQARQDGGTNSASNIAAACLYCNTRRHKRKSPPSPEEYRLLVAERVRKGRWHPFH
ncbi:MAG: HNH endonuclease [Rhodocyclales bacterium]|nr:HNH endonuclease [Rhodocyclales bacterium]